MFSKRLLFVITILLASFSLKAQTDIPKIGLVDPERIIKESMEMQKVYKELQALVEKKQDELKRKQGEVATMEEKYQTQASVLSSEKRSQLEEQIRKGYVELDKFKEDSKIEIQTKENAALGEMEKRVAPIIAEIGKQENYTLIVRKEAVVFMNSSVDITDKVIKKLNETSVPATKPVTPPASTPKPKKINCNCANIENKIEMPTWIFPV